MMVACLRDLHDTARSLNLQPGATLSADGIHSRAAKPIVNVFERNAG
jgi:hypothetical protein